MGNTANIPSPDNDDFDNIPSVDFEDDELFDFEGPTILFSELDPIDRQRINDYRMTHPRLPKYLREVKARADAQGSWESEESKKQWEEWNKLNKYKRKVIPPPTDGYSYDPQPGLPDDPNVLSNEEIAFLKKSKDIAAVEEKRKQQRSEHVKKREEKNKENCRIVIDGNGEQKRVSNKADWNNNFVMFDVYSLDSLKKLGRKSGLKLSLIMWVAAKMGRKNYVAASTATIKRELECSDNGVYSTLSFFRYDASGREIMKVDKAGLDCKTINILKPNPNIFWIGTRQAKKTAPYYRGVKGVIQVTP